MRIVHKPFEGGRDMQQTAVPTAPAIPGVLRCTTWHPGEAPTECDPGDVTSDDVRWIELEAEPEKGTGMLSALQPLCPGLTGEMLEDLLTPDEEPEGNSYEDGKIRLASTFSVQARRLEPKSKRGEVQSAGVLIFHPVELVASDKWLLTCWHPRRTFSGADPVDGGAAVGSGEIRRDLIDQWVSSSCRNAGDLGVLIMQHLALSYSDAYWSLFAWHEDWELGLYMQDELDNPEELPQLWGSMAVLRDWLRPLNRPGLRTHPERAWLPVTRHDEVIALDKRIDTALDKLSQLANTMRGSFNVLHVSLAEQQRERREGIQRRVELIAAAFLVPTLIVGFYGANTWVPGEKAHWGFWVMVAALVALSGLTVVVVWSWQRARAAKAEEEVAARQRRREAMLRSL
jgi:CorA-like Mg2+ transporter protein